MYSKRRIPRIRKKYYRTHLVSIEIPISIERKSKKENKNEDSEKSRTHKRFAIVDIIDRIIKKQTMLNLYQKTFHDSSMTLPAIMDEESALDCIRIISHIHITSFEEYTSENLSSIFLYQKQEDKKHLSILDIRRFLRDISERPYEWKALYLLRDFDEATPEAMNATLKILEEPPPYAIIILIVKNPESLLETIRSRCFLFSSFQQRNLLEDEKKKWIELYFSGESTSLMSYFYNEKIAKDEAQNILLYASKYASKDIIEKIEKALTELFTINETPRNILDRVFL